jgi:signal transduction histidine kinase
MRLSADKLPRMAVRGRGKIVASRELGGAVTPRCGRETTTAFENCAPMNSLPELAGGPVHYCLPLAEETAIRLAGVLLADSADERIERLESALAADAPLALWAVLVATQPIDIAAPLAGLAGWLAPRLTRLLANLSGGGNGSQITAASSSQVDPTFHTVAPIDASVIAPDAADVSDRNHRFLGLLSEAVEWLVECGIPTPDREIAIQMLPAWVVAVIEQIGTANVETGAPQRQRRIPSVAAGPGHELLSRIVKQSLRLGELEESFAQAVEQEKLAALKEFAYGAGHEINNPLANISARAQTLLKEERDPERRQKLAAINSQAFRAHEMIADLMLFAQPPQWTATGVAVGPLIEELESVWRRQAADQETTLAVNVADAQLTAWADRAALAVALKALVANSLEALGRRGTIEITVIAAYLATDSANLAVPDAVAVRIHDNGPGIDPKIRPRIFDPFFSGREAGRGLGFGLPKCWRIVTALGGRIDVASSHGGGATFTVVVPQASTKN